MLFQTIFTGMKGNIREEYFSYRTTYEFSTEESAKEAYVLANSIIEAQFFMIGIVELDKTIVKVPSWFPFIPKHGKEIK
jgi:hypothetical protein